MADEVIINGISLDKPMFWSDEHRWTEATGSAGRAVEGNELYQSYPVSFGRPMTLRGGDSRGWQKKSTVEALRALANQVGVTFNVSYWGTSYTARFVHEGSNPVSFEPVTDVDDPSDDFWYTGTIRLKIIS